MTRVFCPCIRQPHTKEEAADDGTSCRPVTQPRHYFYLFFLRFLSQFWFSKPFQWVNRRLGNQKDTWKPIAALVQPISCTCLRSDGHRKMSNQKRAQGEKKTKKLKTKVDGACQKCRQTGVKRVFPSTLKFQTSHHLGSKKKDLKSFDEQTRANKCTRKEEKEPPAESIYAHVYSITSNGIKEKRKRRKIPKKSIITGPALALDRRRNFCRRWIDWIDGINEATTMFSSSSWKKQKQEKSRL